jgi:hypothetical protein
MVIPPHISGQFGAVKKLDFELKAPLWLVYEKKLEVFIWRFMLPAPASTLSP